MFISTYHPVFGLHIKGLSRVLVNKPPSPYARREDYINLIKNLITLLLGVVDAT